MNYGLTMKAIDDCKEALTDPLQRSTNEIILRILEAIDFDNLLSEHELKYIAEYVASGHSLDEYYAFSSKEPQISLQLPRIYAAYKEIQRRQEDIKVRANDYLEAAKKLEEHENENE